MVYTNCAVYGCMSSSYKNKDLMFHQFPRTEERCRTWIQACRRDDLIAKDINDLKFKFVCSLHFEKSMYGKKNLKKNATPTLKLPIITLNSVHVKTETPNIICIQAEKDMCSIGTQSSKVEIIKSYTKDDSTQTLGAITDHTPRNLKLTKLSQQSSNKLKLFSQKSKEITVQQFTKGCDKYLTPKLSTIVKAQVNMRRHYRSNRHTKEFKLFCMKLYYKNPVAYRFLSSTLCLPSKSILSTTYIPMNTKINQYMWDLLSGIVKKNSPTDRECILCMDFMRLKCSLFYDTNQDKIIGWHDVDGVQKPFAANYAFTLMLRGIESRWKQPVGFAYISSSSIGEELEKWIMDTIEQLFVIGFNIRAVVSDLGSDFLKFSKSKGISVNRSYFEINGHKVYYIFDVLHLMKCVRNNLMNTDFEFDGKTASWDDVKAAYDIDVKKDIRLVPRLTDAHISPNNFQKQKIRFVAQVFSNTVVAALKTYNESQCINLHDGTLDFIKLMNDLFDLLNSNEFHSAKPYNNPLIGDVQQTELLDRARHVLSNLTVISKNNGRDVTESMKFVNTFIITINSIWQLHNDMKNLNLPYLRTRRLNNECLENLFETIRQAGGHCRKPTCVQFSRAFRKSFLFRILSLSEHTNCTANFDNILTEYNNFLKNQYVVTNAS